MANHAARVFERFLAHTLIKTFFKTLLEALRKAFFDGALLHLHQ